VIEPATVRWWQAYAALKWAVICALQAAAHLHGGTPSVELAAIGRRVCESEWDLLDLIGVERPEVADLSTSRTAEPAPFGRPSARELLEAVEGYLDTKVLGDAEGAPRFEAQVARNVLQIVAQELTFGPGFEAVHRARLVELGFSDDAVLAAAIRAGDLDARLTEVGTVLAHSVLEQLQIANPRYATSHSEASR
jgi:hypothetical protein